MVDTGFAPGETKSYSFSWSQRENETTLNGPQAPAGAYTLAARYSVDFGAFGVPTPSVTETNPSPLEFTIR